MKEGVPKYIIATKDWYEDNEEKTGRNSYPWYDEKTQLFVEEDLYDLVEVLERDRFYNPIKSLFVFSLPPIKQQIEELFQEDTIPIYIIGKDIELQENEIQFTASKFREEMVENTNCGIDSVLKPRYKKKITKQTLHFLIRNGIVMVVQFHVSTVS